MSKKIIFAISVLMVAALLLCGCESYRFSPSFSAYPSADSIVYNNGNIAVQQGDYVYFINSKTDYDYVKSNENYFAHKNNRLKGAIMRGTISDGEIKDVDVIVPKDAMTGSTTGGIYVYGEWIYYTSPTTSANFNGEVQGGSTLEFYRTKIDASKTQKICSVDSTSFSYVVTSEAIFYYLDSTLYYVDTTAKRNFKVKTIAEDLSSCYMVKSATYDPAHKNSVAECVFYTKTNDDKTAAANLVYAVDSRGNSHEIFNQDTFQTAERSITNEYSISILDYYVTADGVSLFYTKSHSNNGSTETAGTFCYEFTNGDYTFDKSKEVTLSYDALSSIRAIGAQELICVDSSSYTLYRVKADAEGKPQAKVTMADFDASITINGIVNIGGTDYIMYVSSSTLMIYPLACDGNARTVLSTGYSTSWLQGVVFNNDLLVYCNTADNNYTYCLDLSTIDDEEPVNKLLGILR